MLPIYLDYNATTPVDPAVAECVSVCLRECFGNASSAHVYGKAAHDAIDRARTQVAALLGANADEIVFTSGGSEANNQALLATVFRRGLGTGHIITSGIEHPAVEQPCKFLERLGCKVTVLPVDRHGLVDPDAVRKAIDRHTTIISIMHSNNEVGTLQPIREIAAVARQHGVLIHTDAAQSVGKVPVDVKDLGVDMLSVAGHKVYASKGIGVLYVRRGVTIEPLIRGAAHEGGRRAGTENVPYIVGLGTACEIARQSLPLATEKLRELRDRLWDRLCAGLGERLSLNGHPDQRLPNTLNVNFIGHIGAELLKAIPEIAASTGSACHEGSVKLSPVLAAMGVPAEEGKGAVRLTVGRFSTSAEIDGAAELLVERARR